MEWLENLLMGKIRNRWPDRNCTQTVTEQTRPSRKPKRLRGTSVTPLPMYYFSMPLNMQTDGRQWIIATDTKNISYRVDALFFMFMGLLVLPIAFVPDPAMAYPDGPVFFIIISAVLLLISLYNIFKARTSGEDSWIVFDRTTGNVCFWKKNAKQSLTVPFDQVNCYWTTAYRRGISHDLYLMPTQNRTNERHRWWTAYIGFPSEYRQAQFLWRVLTDFMDNTKPIPEIPGLIHTVRWAQKNGYTIKDLTEGGKAITEADFEAVEDEIQNDIAALDARLDRLLEAEHFNADELIQFYENTPVYAAEKVLRGVYVKLWKWVKILKEDEMMAPGVSRYLTMEQYQQEIDKLVNYFDPIFDARRKALNLADNII